MSGRTKSSAIGSLLVLSGLLSGCSSPPVVGVLLPTTGQAKSYGDSIEAGIKLAEDDLRNRGDLPGGFVLEWADSGSDPERAVAEFRRLVSEKGIKMLIGGVTSSEARALLPVLEETGIVCLSPSASTPNLTKDSNLFFRIYPSDEFEGNAGGNFLIKILKKDTVLLYVGDNAYTDGFEPEFRKQYEETLGGKVVGRVELAAEDWEEQSAQALEKQPKAVYVIAYAERAFQVLQHLKRQGFEGKIMTTSAFYSGQVISEAGELAEGVMFPMSPFDRSSETEPVRGFVKRFLESHDLAPDVFAAHGYDALAVAAKAMTVARPRVTSEILKALRFSVKDFQGVTGAIGFDDFGDVKHYPTMFIVYKGLAMSYPRYVKIRKELIKIQLQKMMASGG